MSEIKRITIGKVGKKDKMSVILVKKYLVKPENQEKFKQNWLRLASYRPELFQEVKSLKLFTQLFGGIAGAYIEMWEFDNLANLET